MSSLSITPLTVGVPNTKLQEVWSNTINYFLIQDFVFGSLSSDEYRMVYEKPIPPFNTYRLGLGEQNAFAEMVMDWARVLHRRIPPLTFGSLVLIETEAEDIDAFGKFIEALTLIRIEELNLHSLYAWNTPRAREIGPLVGRLSELKVFRLKYMEQLLSTNYNLLLDGVWVSNLWAPFLQSIPPVHTFALTTTIPVYPPDKVVGHIQAINPLYTAANGYNLYLLAAIFAPAFVIEHRGTIEKRSVDHFSPFWAHTFHSVFPHSETETPPPYWAEGGWRRQRRRPALYSGTSCPSCLPLSRTHLSIPVRHPLTRLSCHYPLPPPHPSLHHHHLCSAYMLRVRRSSPLRYHLRLSTPTSS
ncbi:hypothetical protein BDN72DRAFT_881301, partial [Pluteus cervinus]